VKVADSCLRWRSASGKGFSVDMKDVKELTKGKVTPNFLAPASADAEQDCCMSLVLASTTVDLELETETARDLLLFNLYNLQLTHANKPKEPKGPSEPKTSAEEGEAETLLWAAGETEALLPPTPISAQADISVPTPVSVEPPLALSNQPLSPPQCAEAPTLPSDDPVTDITQAICEALSLGPVMLHASKGPAEVVMTLVGTELRWSSVLTGRKYRVDFQSILFIESGKQTTNLRSNASKAAPEENCLSLSFTSATLDLEMSSAVAREQMCNACTALMKNILNEKNSHFSTGSNADDESGGGGEATPLLPPKKAGGRAKTPPQNAGEDGRASSSPPESGRDLPLPKALDDEPSSVQAPTSPQ